MSEAILCDRCGKKVERFLGIRLRSEWSMFGIKYDLCKKCTKDFEIFMKTEIKNEV